MLPAQERKHKRLHESSKLDKQKKYRKICNMIFV